jgi:hypothetical protein
VSQSIVTTFVGSKDAPNIHIVRINGLPSNTGEEYAYRLLLDRTSSHQIILTESAYQSLVAAIRAAEVPADVDNG